jgi:hypothetical protein
VVAAITYPANVREFICTNVICKVQFLDCRRIGSRKLDKFARSAAESSFPPVLLNPGSVEIINAYCMLLSCPFGLIQESETKGYAVFSRECQLGSLGFEVGSNNVTQSAMY